MTGERLQLHFMPGTRARVCLIALEEAGEAFEAVPVRFMVGEHKRPPFLALHPEGKVPVLSIGGRPLTETLAIVSWLDARHPEVGLLGRGGDALADALALADLSWTLTTLAPMLTRLRLPFLFAETGEAIGQVRALAARDLDAGFALAERRLTGGEWLVGPTACADATLAWLADQAGEGGLDLSAFPNLLAHGARLRERPAVVRAMAREAEAFALFAREGLPPGPPGPPPAP